MVNLQGTPNIIQNSGLSQNTKHVSQLVNMPLPKRRRDKGTALVVILAIVAVAVVIGLLHFNIIKLPVSVQNISSSSNINAFASANTTQSVMKIINSHIVSNAAFNVAYNGETGLKLGATTINIPTTLSFVKNGNLFRISFSVNYSSISNFISSLFNLTSINSTIQNKTVQLIPPLVSGLLIYNGTGINFCNVKNSSFSNCSYEQLSIPAQNILYSMINAGSTNSTEAVQPANYSNLLSEINTSTYPVFTYKGVSSYGGQQCSSDDIGPVDIGNYSYVGSVCFSDSLGLPLTLQLKASPTSIPTGNFSLFSNIGFSLSFAAAVNSTTPSSSYITALPNGAVFYKK
ncbi:hypothetical protein IHI26_00060 [Candidatus Parvarchaeota archaeon]|nr:hypothetical protein [Candidatus Acidifodinimicrobium mancum]MBE5729724.1 hypothetical protein [Candidatus Acidifodinimicrobium mancum]